MVTPEQLDERRQVVAQGGDPATLLAALRHRAAPLLARMPIIPEAKALLSMDGGVCPDDRTPLAFDPLCPDEHRCPRCGKLWSGERHHRHWARFQHLWVAERAAELAALGAVGTEDDRVAAVRAADILKGYGSRYFQYPNNDNVLGPSRPFFSTYLESIWITNYLAAATLLRSAGLLDQEAESAVTQVADEAANLIGEFDERFSNRQTWNNAALTAIAVWFGDEDLAQRAITGPTGLSAHLLYGFRSDGMWYEGENYHLFALRGLLTGISWARMAGADFMADPRLVERLGAAALAPARSALPDFTFPARKDSRFGVSLAQPMYLDAWEVALSLLPAGDAQSRLAAWLGALYGAPPLRQEVFESYLHDAPFSGELRAPARERLSWWSLLTMVPELPRGDDGWRPGHVLLADQGLAVLRPAPDRYVSLEVGIWGGGHGHPDRLSLTFASDGVLWLPDPGTGSYVSRDLFWYRSTLAHNAPRLDGRSQPVGRAVCEMFGESESWAWARGRAYESLSRTVVAGPRYVIDVLDLTGDDERLLELSWHFAGTVDVTSGGRWGPGALDDEFVQDVETFTPTGKGPIVLRAQAGASRLDAHLVFAGELLRAREPALPGSDHPRTFYLARTRARNRRLVAVLAPGGGVVQDVRASGDVIEVHTPEGVEYHRMSADGWAIETPSWRGRLRGEQEIVPDWTPILDLEPPERARGAAFLVSEPPTLDGTATGFDPSEPITLDLEDQYRRSEEAYPGPEEFAAIAVLAWDDAALYVQVDVVKPEPMFRAADAPPLRLDNEPDDIHSDGLQVYVADPERGEMAGYLIVPEAGGALRVHPVRGTAGDARAVQGSWQSTDVGYRVTLGVAWPESLRPHVGARIGFDLVVNEMLPGRQRRAGQLAWSGGNGWVWLRGDRQDRDRLGEVELVG